GREDASLTCGFRRRTRASRRGRRSLAECLSELRPKLRSWARSAAETRSAWSSVQTRWVTGLASTGAPSFQLSRTKRARTPNTPVGHAPPTQSCELTMSKTHVARAPLQKVLLKPVNRQPGAATAR